MYSLPFIAPAGLSALLKEPTLSENGVCEGLNFLKSGRRERRQPQTRVVSTSIIDQIRIVTLSPGGDECVKSPRLI